MPVHVSIHDVSPAWVDEVEAALALCSRHGMKPALLVVPNFHGGHALDRHPRFAERLRHLQAQGHEVFLHGYYHQARRHADGLPHGQQGRPGRLGWLFAQHIVSGGEAEFRDVSRTEAAERLDAGHSLLTNLGLTMDGFVAPAWAMTPWLLPMLKERGFAFCEDHLRIYDLQRDVTRASVVLNYASRSPGRLLSTVAYCRVAKHARRFVPARIAIHPADMRFALLRHELESLLRWAEGTVVPRGIELFPAASRSEGVHRGSSPSV
jgi:predicted deacetylase